MPAADIKYDPQANPPEKVAHNAPITSINIPKLETTRRALFRQPLALQWLEDGHLVKRREGERQAGRFELFLDLLFVAILANFAEDLASKPSGDQVVKYILILSPAWHVWSDLRELMNSFYNDDLLQRIFILWIMAVLIIYGNNATLVDTSLDAIRATAGAYLVARLSSNAMHLLYSFASYHHRPQQRLWVGLSGLVLCSYVPLFFDGVSLRAKVAAAAVGIVVEEIAWVFCYSPAAKRMLGARYTTAVDIPHEVDRFAAFYIIVLGEYLYQIVVGSPESVGFNLGLMRAVWTLVIAFCLNWLYIHNDGALDCTHPLRISIYAAFPWVILHLPLSASLLAAGHVAAASGADDDVHGGELWLLCGGLGIGLICLYILGMLHKSHDPPKTLILPKHARLALRPALAIVIICLPLSDLDVTAVLSVIMSLLVLCVVWENVTSLMRQASFWERWEGTKYPTGGMHPILSAPREGSCPDPA